MKTLSNRKLPLWASIGCGIVALVLFLFIAKLIVLGNVLELETEDYLKLHGKEIIASKYNVSLDSITPKTSGTELIFEIDESEKNKCNKREVSLNTNDYLSKYINLLRKNCVKDNTYETTYLKCKDGDFVLKYLGF